MKYFCSKIANVYIRCSRCQCLKVYLMNYVQNTDHSYEGSLGMVSKTVETHQIQ